MGRRCGAVAFGIVALLIAWTMARQFVNGPGYTDSFYHLNVANSLLAGDGFVDLCRRSRERARALVSLLDAPDISAGSGRHGADSGAG